MEENKKKTVGWLVFLMILFIITTLALGGFLIYDKLIKKEDSKECNCQKCEEKECPKCDNATCNCPNDSTCTTSNKYDDQMIFSTFGTFYVTSKGEVYYKPGKNYYSSDEVKVEDIETAAKKTLGNSGKYTLTGNKFMAGEQDFSYKLNLSNIRYAIELEFGNGGTNHTVAFVSTNGTISELSYDDFEKSMQFYKDVDGYSNIVSIVPSDEDGGAGAITYDKCGNSKTYRSPRFN